METALTRYDQLEYKANMEIYLKHYGVDLTLELQNSIGRLKAQGHFGTIKHNPSVERGYMLLATTTKND